MLLRLIHLQHVTDGTLINLIVQDCKEQGIETEPESTVIGWLSKWKPEEREV